jgi:hypothetical protein
MANPLTFMTRFVRAARPDPIIARCPVCHENIHADSPALHIRGMHVHHRCATYRMRQRVRRS